MWKRITSETYFFYIYVCLGEVDKDIEMELITRKTNFLSLDRIYDCRHLYVDLFNCK